MRPVALGRKNWLHVGSAKAGPKVAAILSVVESCRRLRRAREGISAGRAARPRSPQALRNRPAHAGELVGWASLIHSDSLSLTCRDPIRSTRGANCRTNSLIRVTIQNVAPSVLAFGIGREQFFDTAQRGHPDSNRCRRCGISSRAVASRHCMRPQPTSSTSPAPSSCPALPNPILSTQAGLRSAIGLVRRLQCSAVRWTVGQTSSSLRPSTTAFTLLMRSIRQRQRQSGT